MDRSELERAIQAIQAHGQSVDKNLLQHLSPLGWEHINRLAPLRQGQRPGEHRR